MAHIYLMPGLAAGSHIFDNWDLSYAGHELHKLDWITPHKKESLQSYAQRIATNIEHENPILLGVSFGGILMQEISRFLPHNQLFVVSSVRHQDEFPARLKFCAATGAQRLVPTSLAKHVPILKRVVPVPIIKRRLELYDMYMAHSDTTYLNWALDTVVCWQQREPRPVATHIHGTADEIFPIQNLQGDHIKVEGGTHIMVVNRYKWFNENLPALIRG